MDGQKDEQVNEGLHRNTFFYLWASTHPGFDPFKLFSLLRRHVPHPLPYLLTLLPLTCSPRKQTVGGHRGGGWAVAWNKNIISKQLLQGFTGIQIGHQFQRGTGSSGRQDESSCGYCPSVS